MWAEKRKKFWILKLWSRRRVWSHLKKRMIFCRICEGLLIRLVTRHIVRSTWHWFAATGWSVIVSQRKNWAVKTVQSMALAWLQDCQKNYQKNTEKALRKRIFTAFIRFTKPIRRFSRRRLENLSRVWRGRIMQCCCRFRTALRVNGTRKRRMSRCGVCGHCSEISRLSITTECCKHKNRNL